VALAGMSKMLTDSKQSSIDSDLTHRFEDYLRRYFPKQAVARRNSGFAEPYAIGVEMAEDALRKFEDNFLEENT